MHFLLGSVQEGRWTGDGDPELDRIRSRRKVSAGKDV